MYSLNELINIILNRSEQLEEQLKQNSDLVNLTNKQLNCIEIIHEAVNPTLTEVAMQLNTSKASASVMVDRLAENGYLMKVKSDSDRRSAHMHLTDKGNRAAHIHVDLHSQFADMLITDLTDSEREILIVLLNKAIKAIQ